MAWAVWAVERPSSSGCRSHRVFGHVELGRLRLPAAGDSASGLVLTGRATEPVLDLQRSILLLPQSNGLAGSWGAESDQHSWEPRLQGQWPSISGPCRPPRSRCARGGPLPAWVARRPERQEWTVRRASQAANSGEFSSFWTCSQEISDLPGWLLRKLRLTFHATNRQAFGEILLKRKENQNHGYRGQ